MKNNWSLIWNPFSRIAGWQAFLLGLFITILSGVIAKFGNLLFDGVIDMHFYDRDITFSHVFYVLAIDLVSLFVIMILGAFILTRNFRIIDIIGTMTLARTPFLFSSIIALFVNQPNTEELLKRPMIMFSYPMFLVFGLITIPVMVWFIALMYNAFKVSTGTKGGKLIVIFVSALIIAEIISKVLIMMIWS